VVEKGIGLLGDQEVGTRGREIKDQNVKIKIVENRGSWPGLKIK
jgi:hypothetical protein